MNKTKDIIPEKFSGDSNKNLNNFKKDAVPQFNNENIDLHDKEIVMGNITINDIKKVKVDEKINFDERTLKLKPIPTKQYGISSYGNIWCIGDAEQLDREITCNWTSLTAHYDISEQPVLQEGQIIETSDKFSMQKIVSAPIAKVINLTELEYQKLQEALKAIHETYGAVRITPDPINDELSIEGFTKNGFEIVGHITKNGHLKEYEIQPHTPYKNNQEVLDTSIESFMSTLAEERKISDDDKTKLLCDILERLPILGEQNHNIENPTR